MAAKKSETQPVAPVVRVAPLGELKAYTVYEHELDTLSRGSAGSLFLNFALCLLPISVTLVVTLATTAIASDRLFQGFVSVAAITAIIGLILLLLWWREHQNSKAVIQEIKNRMPPPQGIPQTASDQAASTTPSPTPPSSPGPAG